MIKGVLKVLEWLPPTEKSQTIHWLNKTNHQNGSGLFSLLIRSWGHTDVKTVVRLPLCSIPGKWGTCFRKMLMKSNINHIQATVTTHYYVCKNAQLDLFFKYNWVNCNRKQFWHFCSPRLKTHLLFIVQMTNPCAFLHWIL